MKFPNSSKAMMHLLRGILLLYFSMSSLHAQEKLIHVYVALCDNEFQGIVPVPASIGDGTKPGTNLYWGAGYGVSNFFDKKTTDWTLVSVPAVSNPLILDRVLFKHKDSDIYLLADAYEGEFIKNCIEDFLYAANGQLPDTVAYKNEKLVFGGEANLIAYVGHNGLMDFKVRVGYRSNTPNAKDVMLLGCYTKSYFNDEISRAGANPVLWTTHLMAPEAYTLHAAIEGWINDETEMQIEERAAQAYNKYQKCGINGARNLFTYGF